MGTGQVAQPVVVTRENFMLSELWKAMGSVQLSIVLFGLLFIDLCIGYLCLEGRTTIFQPLNDVGLWRWLKTYGQHNLAYTGWFYVLLPLLFLLAINTLSCTITKLTHLFRHPGRWWRKSGTRLTLSIHLMHLAVIVMLAGYLTSYTMGEVQQAVPLPLGKTLTLTDKKLRVTLKTLELIPYEADRLASFSNRYIDAHAWLTVSGPGNTQQQIMVGMNRPAWVQGYLFLMNRFNPRYIGGMSSARYIVLDIRKDYGGIITLSGMAGFILGLLGYLLHRTPFVQRRRSQNAT